MQAPASTATFWNQLDHLLHTSTLVIDRPRGTAHPRYPETVYPLDYGYLLGTTSGDGEGIDVWVGSLPEPDRKVTGAVVTVDIVKRDSEIKVLVGCTAEEARVVLTWHNDGGQAAMLLERRIESVRAASNHTQVLANSEITHSDYKYFVQQHSVIRNIL